MPYSSFQVLFVFVLLSPTIFNTNKTNVFTLHNWISDLGNRPLSYSLGVVVVSCAVLYCFYFYCCCRRCRSNKKSGKEIYIFICFVSFAVVSSVWVLSRVIRFSNFDSPLFF